MQPSLSKTVRDGESTQGGSSSVLQVVDKHTDSISSVDCEKETTRAINKTVQETSQLSTPVRPRVQKGRKCISRSSFKITQHVQELSAPVETMPLLAKKANGNCEQISKPGVITTSSDPSCDESTTPPPDTVNPPTSSINDLVLTVEAAMAALHGQPLEDAEEKNMVLNSKNEVQNTPLDQTLEALPLANLHDRNEILSSGPIVAKPGAKTRLSREVAMLMQDEGACVIMKEMEGRGASNRRRTVSTATKEIRDSHLRDTRREKRTHDQKNEFDAKKKKISAPDLPTTSSANDLPLLNSSLKELTNNVPSEVDIDVSRVSNGQSDSSIVMTSKANQVEKQKEPNSVDISSLSTASQSAESSLRNGSVIIKLGPVSVNDKKLFSKLFPNNKEEIQFCLIVPGNAASA